MKTQYKILFLIILIAGCNLIENEEQYSGVSIYKTRGDYFNLVSIGMKGDEIYYTQSLWNSGNNSLQKMEVRNNDTIYKYRYRLGNGYILAGEAGLEEDVFLELSFKDYLKREIKNDEMGIGVSVPGDTLKKYILDKDPYIEFYQNRTDVKRLYLSDSLEIERIIKNGELDKYFKQLK